MGRKRLVEEKFEALSYLSCVASRNESEIKQIAIAHRGGGGAARSLESAIEPILAIVGGQL